MLHLKLERRFSNVIISLELFLSQEDFFQNLGHSDIGVRLLSRKSIKFYITLCTKIKETNVQYIFICLGDLKKNLNDFYDNYLLY